jgi:hypothetical protein
MSVPTAAELEAALNPEILVSVPDSPFEIICRRPDLETLILLGLIQLPHLQAALALRESTTTTIDERPADVRLTPALEVINVWVCAAAVRPRIVQTKTPAETDAVLVDILPFRLKLAIVHATSPQLSSPAGEAAGAEFRGRADGESPGPGGAAVRDPAVDVPADAGSPAGV